MKVLLKAIKWFLIVMLCYGLYGCHRLNNLEQPCGEYYSVYNQNPCGSER